MFESESIRRPAVYLTLAALVLGTIAVVLARSTSGAGAASAQQRKPAAAAKPARGPRASTRSGPLRERSEPMSRSPTRGRRLRPSTRSSSGPYSSFAPARPISRRGRSSCRSIGDH